MRKLAIFLIVTLLLSICITASAAVTATFHDDCSYPIMNDLAYTKSCTVTFKTAIEGSTITVSHPPWFLYLQTTSTNCSIQSQSTPTVIGKLTVANAGSAGVTCVFTVANNGLFIAEGVVPATATLGSQTETSNISFPTKSFDPNFVNLKPDCKSTSVYCSLILGFTITDPLAPPTLTLRGTNFKITAIATPADFDSTKFALLPSVSSSTLAIKVTQQAGIQYFAMQFLKPTAGTGGCIPSLFSLHVVLPDSVMYVPISTGREACSLHLSPVLAANCNDPSNPLCTVTINSSTQIGTGYTAADALIVKDFFLSPDVDSRPPFVAVQPRRVVNNQIMGNDDASPCAIISGTDLKIFFPSTETKCSFAIYKPDMEIGAQTEFSLNLIASKAADQDTFGVTPIKFSRVYTNPVFNANFGDNCSDPVVPYCTYTFEAYFTKYLYLTHRDIDLIGKHSTASSSPITISCTGANGSSDTTEIDFVGLSTSDGLTKHTCTFTVELPIRHTIINSQASLFFLVAVNPATVPTTPNSELKTLKAYPPKFIFDPITSIIVSPACSQNDIHICTVSFTHPRPLSPSVPLQIAISRPPVDEDDTDDAFVAYPILPVPDDAISIIFPDDGLRMNVWQLAHSELPFSTIAFPKGTIVQGLHDFYAYYYRVGTLNLQPTLQPELDLDGTKAPTPVLATYPASLVHVVQSSFVHILSDCLDPTTSLCTLSYQTFTSSMSIAYTTVDEGVVGADVTFVGINSEMVGIATITQSENTQGTVVSKFVRLTNLPINGETVTLTFSTTLASTAFSIFPTIYTKENDEIVYNDPQIVPCAYTEDALFSPQGNCGNLNEAECLLSISFSNLKVKQGAVLLQFTLPLAYQFVPKQSTGACAAIETTSSVQQYNGNDLTFITMTALEDPGDASGLPIMCQVTFRKIYSMVPIPVHITSLFSISPNMSREINAPYQPVMLIPNEGCNTYPANGVDFACRIVFGFMGGIVSSFSTPLPSTGYSWFATEELGAVNCHGAMDHVIGTLAVTNNVLTFSPSNGEPLNMITFCQLSYTFTASGTTPYDLTPLTSLWTLDNGSGQTSSFQLTLPAPPLAPPVRFSFTEAPISDPYSPVDVTITLELDNITTIKLSGDYDFSQTTGNCGALLSFNNVLNQFTVSSTYTLGDSCVWRFYPTSRTPTGPIKHDIVYSTGLTHYAHIAYPRFYRVVEFLQGSEPCIETEFCSFQVKINAKFDLAMFDNIFSWIPGTTLPCSATDGTVIATFELVNDKMQLTSTSTDALCTANLPISVKFNKQWVNFSLQSTQLTAGTYDYQVYIPDQVPINYISLEPTYCRLGSTCTYTFTINDEYLKLRPMFSFVSPFAGYWEAQDGNFCDVSQVGTDVYLRVIRDQSSFTSFGLPSTCTLVMKAAVSTLADPTTAPANLQINRYHLPQEQINAILAGDTTPLYETERYAPPDLARYEQKQPLLLPAIRSYLPTHNPVSVTQPPNTSCVAAVGHESNAHCTLQFTINDVVNIKTIRITNFMSFKSVVDIEKCYYSATEYVNFVPSVDSTYVYAQYKDGLEAFPPDFICTMTRVLAETRGGVSQTHSYEFFGAVGNTNDLATTVYSASHSANYPAYSPFGFYLEADPNVNSRLVVGADTSWIRFLAARPHSEHKEVTPVNYRRLIIQFAVPAISAASYEANPTINYDIFSQLVCHAIPRDKNAAVHPTCLVSPSITGDPTQISIDFSDNANSQTLDGFYIAFTTHLPPTSILGFNLSVTSIDSLSIAQISSSLAIPVSTQSAVPPFLDTPHTLTINVWPAEYEIDNDDASQLTADEAMIFFTSETNFLEKNKPVTGTDITIALDGILPGSYIDVMLYSSSILDLPTLVRTRFIPAGSDLGGLVENTTSPDCELCLSFKPLTSASKIKFTIRIQYVDRASSWNGDITASNSSLRVAVKTPTEPATLPFAITTLQARLYDSGNSGTIGPNTQLDIENMLTTVFSWTSKRASALLSAFTATPTIRNTNSGATILHPDAIAVGVDYELDYSPLPAIGNGLVAINTASRIQQSHHLSCASDLSGASPELNSFPDNTPLEQTSEPGVLKFPKITAAQSGKYCALWGKHTLTRTLTNPRTGVSLRGGANTIELVYYTVHPFNLPPVLAPGTMQFFLNSIVCNSLTFPSLYAAPDSTTAASTFTVSTPLGYKYQDVSTAQYALTYTGSTTTTNSFKLVLQPGNVYGIFSTLTCPPTDSVDATTQTFTYRSVSNPQTINLDVSNGYLVLTPITGKELIYTAEVPTYGVQDEKFIVRFKFMSSLHHYQDAVVYTPQASRMHLFRLDTLSDDGSNVDMINDPTDATRALLYTDRDLFLFDTTRWDVLSSPLYFPLPIEVSAPFYNDILTQICAGTVCTAPVLHATRIVPVFSLDWTLRLEVGTEIPSTFTINRDMLIQDYIIMTWTSDEFDATYPYEIEYSAYTYTIDAVTNASTGKTLYTATIAFARFWLANVPIKVPLMYLQSKQVNPKVTISAYTTEPGLVDMVNRDAAEAAANAGLEAPEPVEYVAFVENYVLQSVEYGPLSSSNRVPVPPIDKFSFTPSFGPSQVNTFSLTLGRPLLFGQQLTFSPLPLAPNQSVSITIEADEIVTIPNRATNAIVTVTQVFQFVVQTGNSADYPGCKACSILTLATTSQLPIPDRVELQFQLGSIDTETLDGVEFDSIFISSAGFGSDNLELKQYRVAYRPNDEPFRLFSAVVTSITPKKLADGQVPICLVGRPCDLVVSFSTSFVHMPTAALVTFTFIGYKLDVQRLPTGTIQASSGEPTTQLYSFSEESVIFLIRGADLNKVTSMEIDILFTQETLDGYFSFNLRNLNGFADVSVPDIFDSSAVLGPQVFPDKADTIVFYTAGGAFQFEAVSYGVIPTIPYTSTGSTYLPAAIRFQYHASYGGLYTFPTAGCTDCQTDQEALPENVFKIDSQGIPNTKSTGAVRFVEHDPAVDPDKPAVDLTIMSIVGYFAANEPLIVQFPPNIIWANEYQPRYLTGSAVDAYVSDSESADRRIAINEAPFQFLHIRPIRAVRTIPSVTTLYYDEARSFKLNIYEDFLDHIRFLPADTIILSIPVGYEVLSTVTQCTGSDGYTKSLVPGLSATLTYLGVDPAHPDTNLLQFSPVVDDAVFVLPVPFDPEYSCDITVKAISKILIPSGGYLAIEGPYSKLTFTAASLDTTSSFDFFMPYPILKPRFELNFVSFDTVGIPGYLWFRLSNVYFSPVFKLQFALPFSMTIATSDSVICRSPIDATPMGRITYLAATGEVLFETFNFLSIGTLECRFRMIPLSAYDHDSTQIESAAQLTSGATLGDTTTNPVDLIKNWYVAETSTNVVDPETAVPSYAIAAPVPQMTLQGDVISGLSTDLTITGEHMSLQPGDSISFSIGVTFAHSEGFTDITGLQCLSNSNEAFADVRFQFVGDSVPGTSPSSTALPDGKLGIANRVQLIPIGITPPSTPWRCTITLKSVAAHTGRRPDALIQGVAYPTPSLVSIVNSLTFRSGYTFGLGLARADTIGPSMGQFSFFYNSTDVNLVQNGATPTVQMEIPFVFTSTPVDGLICQLNYGNRVHLPFFITATSSVATSFLVPVERLIVPTSASVNNLRCLIPNLSSKSSFQTNHAKFIFKDGLISTALSLPAASGLSVSYQAADRATGLISADAWTDVQFSSSDAIPIEIGQEVVLRWNLAHIPRITPLAIVLSDTDPVLFGRACINIGSGADFLVDPIKMYQSNDTLAWVTLQDELPTYCDMTVRLSEFAVPGTVVPVAMRFGDWNPILTTTDTPVHSAFTLNFQVKNVPSCRPLDSSFVYNLDRDYHWVLTADEVRNYDGRVDQLAQHFRTHPFHRLDALTNVRMACTGFETPAATFGLKFGSNPTTGKNLNQLATTWSQFLIHKDANSVDYISSDCRNLSSCVGPASPIPLSNGEFIIDWLVQLDSFVPGLDFNNFNTTTPYTLEFSISTNPADPQQTYTFPMKIDISSVPRPAVPPSPSASITSLEVSPTPRGKVGNFLLSIRDLPRGEAWAVPMWEITGLDATEAENAKVTDFFTSPLKVFGDDTLGSPVTCYDVNNVGTIVLAYVSIIYSKPIPGLTPPMIAFGVLPDVDAISKADVSSNGMNYQCIFPLLPIAPTSINFVDLSPTLLGLIGSVMSQFPTSKNFVQDTALRLTPSFVRPSFSTLFAPTFNGLNTLLGATFDSGITITQQTAYITIAVDGTKVFPGDSIVLQFKPLVDENGSTRSNPDPAYRFFAPPAADQPTPCYNLFYPTGLEPVGYLTALTESLDRQLGQASNTVILDIVNARIGDFQQLVCTSPFTTFTSVDVHGAIYGRLYKPHEFKLLQSVAQYGQFRYQFTTDYRPELLLSTAILYYLQPMGYIGEPIKKNLYLSAHLLGGKVPAAPVSKFTVRFAVASTPPRQNVTLVADMREYAPSGLVGCNAGSNIRFFGQDAISDETRNILRIDFPLVTESDIYIDCQFYSPKTTPQSYWAKSIIMDGYFYILVPNIWETEDEVNQRPNIVVPVSLYNTADLTPGGMPVSSLVRTIATSDLYLQSCYTRPDKAILVSLYFVRPRANPYIDGTERAQFLTSLSRAFGKRVSASYNLYTLFKSSDLVITTQIPMFDDAANFLVQDPVARQTSVTMFLTVSFPSIYDTKDLVAPYGTAGVYEALKGFGVDENLTKLVLEKSYSSIIYSQCFNNACGGDCEACPAGDICYNDAGCRPGLHCLTVAGSVSESLVVQGTCVEQNVYDRAYQRYVVNKEVATSGFNILTSNTVSSTKSPTANDEENDETDNNSAMMQTSLFAIVVMIVAVIF